MHGNEGPGHTWSEIWAENAPFADNFYGVRKTVSQRQRARVRLITHFAELRVSRWGSGVSRVYSADIEKYFLTTVNLNYSRCISLDLSSSEETFSQDSHNKHVLQKCTLKYSVLRRYEPGGGHVYLRPQFSFLIQSTRERERSTAFGAVNAADWR